MARVPMTKVVQCWPFHNWSKWGDTESGDILGTRAIRAAARDGISRDELAGRRFVCQERRCETCGKVQLRKEIE